VFSLAIGRATLPATTSAAAGFFLSSLNRRRLELSSLDRRRLLLELSSLDRRRLLLELSSLDRRRLLSLDRRRLLVEGGAGLGVAPGPGCGATGAGPGAGPGGKASLPGILPDGQYTETTAHFEGNCDGKIPLELLLFSLTPSFSLNRAG